MPLHSICAFCNEPFRATTSRKTCSDECQHKLRWNNRRSSQKELTKDCKVCKCPFATADARQMYCSSECKRQVHRDREARRRIILRGHTDCRICGDRFLATDRRVKVCSSPRCRREQRRQRDTLLRASRQRHEVCVVCDEVFVKRNTSITCSKECSRKRWVSFGYTTHRKRAKYFGVEYEPISRLKVCERDKWRCGICGKKVDKRLKWPHSMSATIDHIVPVYEGGGHIYVNVQCAHALCNIRKGRRGGGEQLALIG